MRWIGNCRLPSRHSYKQEGLFSYYPNLVVLIDKLRPLTDCSNKCCQLRKTRHKGGENILFSVGVIFTCVTNIYIADSDFHTTGGNKGKHNNYQFNRHWYFAPKREPWIHLLLVNIWKKMHQTRRSDTSTRLKVYELVFRPDAGYHPRKQEP